jgi:hypothetical protein
MTDSRAVKVLAAIGALVVLGAVMLRFTESPASVRVAPVARLPATDPAVAVSPLPRPLPEEAAGAAADEAGASRIPRAKVEEFLQLRKRSAASLLAGFHALQDTNLLFEAAARFPNDPQVQWTMLAQELVPAERRRWLDLFKQSSPDNSLANYLSAAERFNSGKPEDAIRELLEASGKKQFRDYTMAAMLEEQELARFAGLTPFEAIHANGWGSDLLAQLPPLKVVANGIAEAQARYQQSGDTDSASVLIQAGLGLSDRLTEGEGGRFVISQLVGIAIEAIMLKQLPADTKYDFLGGKTPAERQEELKRQRADFRSLNADISAAYAQMTEADWQSYSDRMKTYGEFEAMKWLQQLTATRAQPGK